MKILVACEESQAVTIAFRKRGHEAYSCDLEPCSGGHPEWHLQVDALELLKMKWDMIIAFPPCTYLSNAGAKHLFRNHVLNEERYQKGLKAKEFFLKFFNADCPKIAVENPVSSRIFEMPKHTQEIQPYFFGHPVTKKTRLWLKGLLPLLPTNIVEPMTTCREAGNWFNKASSKVRSKIRSKTFSGVAEAMASQWGGIVMKKSKLKVAKTSNDDAYVKRIENSVVENGGIIFDPANGNLHIDKSLLELPQDISEMPSHELGNTLNVFTQQKIYLRTAIMRLELMAESARRKFYASSESTFAALTSKRMSESAKERILATDKATKEVYEEWTDKKYILSYMQTILANIEDSIFLLSREISRRSSDYSDENRVHNVQSRRY